MMMLKWKSSSSKSEGNGATVTEKDGDGDHRGGYRTHLIFAGKRDPESSSGPTGGSHSGSHVFGGHSVPHSFSHSNHPFGQAQQIRPSSYDPRVRKGSRPGEDDGSRAVTKQVSFGGGTWDGRDTSTLSGRQGPYGTRGQLDDTPGMLEVVTGISRDCFIIPLACVDRFLPAGLTLPDMQTRSNNNSSAVTAAAAPLNVLQVADPQLAVVVHLMTPLIPLQQSLESAAYPEKLQGTLALELIERAKVERQAAHGLLLASMENSPDFPFIAMYVVPKMRIDPLDFLDGARRNALETFDPSVISHCGENFFHLCREVATIARPPSEGSSSNKKTKGSSTGFIVSIFRVFDGDDREKLERNWLYWTGARTLYRHLPKSVGLRRITLHKSAAVTGDKLYLLLCECSNFLENVNSAAQLLPALRARLCGYTGIYRISHAF